MANSESASKSGSSLSSQPPDPDENATGKDDGHQQIEDRATGQIVRPFHIAVDAEHASHMQDVVKQVRPRIAATDPLCKDGDLRGMAKEEVRMLDKLKAQRQKDNKRRHPAMTRPPTRLSTPQRRVDGRRQSIQST